MSSGSHTPWMFAVVLTPAGPRSWSSPRIRRPWTSSLLTATSRSPSVRATRGPESPKCSRSWGGPPAGFAWTGPREQAMTVSGPARSPCRAVRLRLATAASASTSATATAITGATPRRTSRPTVGRHACRSRRLTMPAPRPHAVARRPDDHITVRFNEPVNGITTESGTMRQGAGRTVRLVRSCPRGHLVLPGRRRSGNELRVGQRAEGDVRPGHIRFVASRNYVVDAEPGVLSQRTDLAGNPFVRDEMDSHHLVSIR